MYCMVYITTSNLKESEYIAEALVDKRLVACCNIIPEIRSIYWWKGKVERDNESVIIAKTKQDKVSKIIEQVKKIHSYDTPCIVAYPMMKGSDDYINWLEGELIH